MAECPVSYLSKVMAISNEMCLLIGGAIDIKQTKVFPYVFQANQDGNLERKTNMLQARAAFGCHLDKASKRVYVIGGSINQDEATDQCEVYDIEKDNPNWQTVELSTLKDNDDREIGAEWSGTTRSQILK